MTLVVSPNIKLPVTFQDVKTISSFTKSSPLEVAVMNHGGGPSNGTFYGSTLVSEFLQTLKTTGDSARVVLNTDTQTNELQEHWNSFSRKLAAKWIVRDHLLTGFNNLIECSLLLWPALRCFFSVLPRI